MVAESLAHILEVAHVIMPGDHVYVLADWELEREGCSIAQQGAVGQWSFIL